MRWHVNFVAALQNHYAILQAIALDENEMPEVEDETLPDVEGMLRYRLECKLNTVFV